jgi:hypothetical protein
VTATTKFAGGDVLTPIVGEASVRHCLESRSTSRLAITPQARSEAVPDTGSGLACRRIAHPCP